MSEFSLNDVSRLNWASSAVGDEAGIDPYASRSLTSDISQTAWGINHRQTPLPVPINKDHYGLTFFTRPQLNLQRANIRHARRLHPLLTTESKSWQRYVRCMLDPRLGRDWDASNADSSVTRNLECPLIDEKNAFIPILTNMLNSISGWPDSPSPTYTSKAGLYKEEWSMVDGNIVNYTAYDLTANFRNLKANPIKQLFSYWCLYQSWVYDGTLMPYPDMILSREIDYQTRIYRLILDASKTYVQQIAACGAAFPIATPEGNTFDFSIDKPYNDTNNEVSIPFKCSGFICNDDILIRTFNETVAIFNPDMMPESMTETHNYCVNEKPDDSKMTKIPRRYLSLFNCRGYPRIDPETFELEWYVPRNEFNDKMQALEQFEEYMQKALVSA